MTISIVASVPPASQFDVVSVSVRGIDLRRRRCRNDKGSRQITASLCPLPPCLHFVSTSSAFLDTASLFGGSTHFCVFFPLSVLWHCTPIGISRAVASGSSYAFTSRQPIRPSVRIQPVTFPMHTHTHTHRRDVHNNTIHRRHTLVPTRMKRPHGTTIASTSSFQ